MKVCLVGLHALAALSHEHKAGRIGGAEVQLAQLGAALARRKVRVGLVAEDLGQPDAVSYAGVTVFKAFEPHAGLPVIRFVHPRWTTLWAAFKRADADVYYVSCAGMVVGMLALFCRLHKRRLVFRAGSDSDCEPSRLLVGNWRDRRLYEYGLRHADAVLVQSVKQQDAMQRNYARSSTIVRSFVERPLPDAATVAKDVDVLWVANLRHLKRPDRLLELARSMPAVRFHMAGGPMPGEGELFEQIRAEATTIPNLVFHGPVPYMDIGRLFDRARVFVNTSEVEGFPNTLLQAWARGMPVATLFDPDGVVQRLGLGSSHADVGELRAGVARLLGDAFAYRSASAAASAYMQERFDEDAILAPYLQAMAPERATPRDAVSAWPSTRA